MKKEVCVMADKTQKPTAYIFGARKKDAPPEPVITKQQMEKAVENANKFTRK